MAALEKTQKAPNLRSYLSKHYSKCIYFFPLHLMGNTKKQLKQSEVELIWDERLKGEGEGDASS